MATSSKPTGARERAGVTKAALEARWGDELPPTDDPVRDVLADAIAVDDQAGREVDLVVQGDHLTLAVLVTLVHRAATSPAGASRASAADDELVALLPEGLRERVRGRLLAPATGETGRKG